MRPSSQKARARAPDILVGFAVALLVGLLFVSQAQAAHIDYGTMPNMGNRNIYSSSTNDIGISWGHPGIYESWYYENIFRANATEDYFCIPDDYIIAYGPTHSYRVKALALNWTTINYTFNGGDAAVLQENYQPSNGFNPYAAAGNAEHGNITASNWTAPQLNINVSHTLYYNESFVPMNITVTNTDSESLRVVYVFQDGSYMTSGATQEGVYQYWPDGRYPYARLVEISDNYRWVGMYDDQGVGMFAGTYVPNSTNATFHATWIAHSVAGTSYVGYMGYDPATYSYEDLISDVNTPNTTVLYDAYNNIKVHGTVIDFGVMAPGETKTQSIAKIMFTGYANRTDMQDKIEATIAEADLYYNTTEFQYSQTINLTGSADGALTGYQYYFDVYNTTGTSSGHKVYLNGHSQNATQDVRFTSTDGSTTFPYWMQEDSRNASYARYWVNITQTIPASPANLTIKCQYGNPYVGNNGSIFTAFYGGDDFDAATLNTTIWIDGTGGHSTIADGYINITANSTTYRQITTVAQRVPNGYGVMARIKTAHNASTSYKEYLRMYSTGGRMELFYSSPTFPAQYSTMNGGSSTQKFMTGLPGPNTWFIQSCDRNSVNNSVLYNINWANPVVENTNVYTGDDLDVALILQTDGASMSCDWIAIKRYTPNEPAATYLSETYLITQNLTASFSSNVTTGNIPLTVQFTDTSPGTPTAWNWSFGDGNYSAAQHPSHVYYVLGSYNVTLNASNANGSNTITKTGYITATQLVPVADFTANVTSGIVPLSVLFMDTSTNTPTAWNWSFGDGTYSTLQNPSHIYSTPGTYTVSLNATNGAGSNVSTKSNYITAASFSTVYGECKNFSVSSPLGVLTDYPVLLKVYNTTGADSNNTFYLNGTSQSWPYDIRFALDNGTALYYWTEYNNTTMQYVWVKIPSIPASPGTVNITMYYNRSGDTGASDGNNTFLFFDHFLGAALDTTKWLMNYHVTPTVANSIVKIKSSSGAAFLGTLTDAAVGTNFTVNTSFMSRFNSSSTTGEYYNGYRANDDSNVAMIAGTAASTATVGRTKSGGTGVNTGTLMSDKANFHTFEVQRNGTTSVKFLYDHGTSTMASTYIPSGRLPLALSTWSTSYDTYVDWVAVRPFVSQEPTVAPIVPPAPPVPVASFTMNVTGGEAPLSVAFTDTSANTPTAWSWNFGDGNTSTEQNPIHAYVSLGRYTVTLNASSVNGSSLASSTVYAVTTYPTLETNLPGWTYWKDHNVTSTVDLFDYQVNLTLYNTSNTDSGSICYLGSHVAQKNWSDLRITDGSNNPLAFKITERYSDHVEVWVKVPYIKANVNTTIRLQYGNATCLWADNGSDTFIYYHQFDGTDILHREGNVNYTGWSWNTFWEPNVIYDTDPVILTNYTHVFKAWYHGSTMSAQQSVGYAESPDGYNWTGYADNPVLPLNYACDDAFKYNGKYYVYALNSSVADANGWTNNAIDRFSSDDGVHFTADKYNVIPHSQSWDTAYGNMFVWVEGSTWYMMYEASPFTDANGAPWQIGIATSSDGLTWTPYAGNPVITRATEHDPNTGVHMSYGAPNVHKINDTYYVFCHGGEGSLDKTNAWWLWTSSDLQTFTKVKDDSVVTRITPADGAGVNGQMDHPNLIEVNGVTYIFYATSNSYGNPEYFSLQKANMTIAQLFQTDMAVNYNATYWTKSGDGTRTCISGNMTLTSTAANSVDVYSNPAYGPGVSVLVRAKLVSSSGNMMIGFAQASNNTNATVRIKVGASAATLESVANGTTSTQSIGSQTGKYQTYDVQWPSSGSARFAINGAEVGTLASNVPTNPLNLDFNSNTANAQSNITYIAVRSLSGTPPTNGDWSPEQSSTLLVVANFTSNVTSGTSPLVVQFNDTSANTPTAWYWTFGDGNYSTEQNPIHVYYNPTAYNATRNVTLNATNEAGTNSTTKTDYIAVVPQAPVANIGANRTHGQGPLDVQFVDNSTGASSSWLWDFDDGTNSTAASPMHTFPDNAGPANATYHVNLTVGNDGGNSTDTIEITVLPWPPTPGFTSNITSGTSPLVVQFNSTTDHASSWNWSFGDGTYSNEENPVYAYPANPGPAIVRYTVALTAGNDGGSQTVSVPDYITILPPAPVANFAANRTTTGVGGSVAFTDESTGTPGTWEWSFGDGTANSTSRNPSHTYTQIGTFTVTLTVFNPGGSTTLQRAGYITIVAVPVAGFMASPTSGRSPLTVAFTDTSSGSPTAWEWNFGDGTPNSTSRNPSHVFPNNPGPASVRYTITLTASSPMGGTSIQRVNYITVDPYFMKPVARFHGVPLSGNVPLTVQFTDDSLNQPTAWAWSFGDGATSNQQNPTHTYTKAGYFPVELTASNPAGGSTTTYSKYIHVISYPTLPAVSLDPLLRRGVPSAIVNHSVDTSYYENLTTYVFQPNLNITLGNWTVIPGILVREYADSIGENWFWLILMGVPALILFWRSRSPFLPSALLLIEAPILWSFVPASFRAPLIGIACLAFIGVAYSFYMGTKRP